MDNNIPNLWIADRIREAIRKNHTTEKATADAALIPWTTWYRRMRGAGSFDWDELLRIADALDYAPSFFTPPQFQHSKEAA